MSSIWSAWDGSGHTPDLRLRFLTVARPPAPWVLYRNLAALILPVNETAVTAVSGTRIGSRGCFSRADGHARVRADATGELSL